MEFASGADYPEQNKREYVFYIPEWLKNMPPVSNSCYFHYASVSDPNPALNYQVRLFGTTDSHLPGRWLEKNGCKKPGAVKATTIPCPSRVSAYIPPAPGHQGESSLSVPLWSATGRYCPSFSFASSLLISRLKPTMPASCRCQNASGISCG
ncbi:hypothetical protein BG55_09005 [Erwinia mallotivora]|uniref:Uncharacterized protein n=1 Tax=Erwinia mallotivora TaxID=69222 RepID=A0A014M1S0_9GAMM|nr:hypothetical protein BG55_09005 [Erwinia mallotivora]